jgi:hypothetical protein
MTDTTQSPKKLDPKKAAAIAEIRNLLRGAEYALDHPDFLDSAVWRLVDAAGLAYQSLPKEQQRRLIGAQDHTGRGFKLSGPGMEGK